MQITIRFLAGRDVLRSCRPFLNLCHKHLTAVDAMVSLFPHNERHLFLSQRPQQISKQFVAPNMYNAFITLSDLHFMQLYDKVSVQSLSGHSFREFGFAHVVYSKHLMARWCNPDFSIQAFQCTAVMLLRSLSIDWDWESSGLQRERWDTMSPPKFSLELLWYAV